jgi:hypothetical protein
MITFELNVKSQFNKSFGIKFPLFPSISIQIKFVHISLCVHMFLINV